MEQTKLTPKSAAERTGITPWDLTANELHILEYLAGLDCQLIAGQKILEERLRACGAWRDFRIAATACERALDRVYDTVPQKSLRHMLALAEHGEIVFRPKPAVPGPDMQLCMGSDLKTIVNEVVGNVCAICVKEAGQQRSCKLRRAMQEIAPSNIRTDKYHCPYIEVAAGCRLGEYIE